MKKRLLGLAMVLTVVFSVVPIVSFCVSAESETEATSGEVYKDTFTDKLTDETYKVGITMYSGAQIRLNDVSGIRFLSVADADKIAALKSEGATVEIGTLIMPKDLLGSEELMFETSINGEKPIDVKYEADEWNNNIKGRIAGSIINIKEENIAREFVGRAYVKVIKDGKTYTNYSVVADENIRSLAFVANKLKNDTEEYQKLNDIQKNMIDIWSEKYMSSFKACNLKTSEIDKFQYYLYTPSNPTANMPLIVYLHGGSGKGDDLSVITAADGFPKYLQSGALGDVRAYVIIPQLPADKQGWASVASSVYELINETALKCNIDKSNISLTGHSMGGTGTWNLAVNYPDLFARIAPLSGSIRNTEENINVLKNIPVRAFVGSQDTIVSPQSSKEVIYALKKAGGDAEITEFEGSDHFSVPSLTYLDKSINLINWLIDFN